MLKSVCGGVVVWDEVFTWEEGEGVNGSSYLQSTLQLIGGKYSRKPGGRKDCEKSKTGR